MKPLKIIRTKSGLFEVAGYGLKPAAALGQLRRIASSLESQGGDTEYKKQVDRCVAELQAKVAGGRR